mgnify:CR=1 FL=1
MSELTDLHTVEGGCLPVRFLVLGPIENNVYFINDAAATIVVDPSCEVDSILEALGGRKLDAIVLTHRHWDHVGAAAALRRATGATVIASTVDAPYITREKIMLGEKDHGIEPCPVDYEVNDGDVVQIGDMAWRVFLTPGHTPGSMCLFIDPRFGTNKAGAPILIAGDTLFFGSIGRTDFSDGSMDDMRESLKHLAVLPDKTIVLPGHASQTTIGAERRRVFARYAPTGKYETYPRLDE